MSGAKKTNFKDKAKQLKTDFPDVFIALKRKER